MDIKKIKLYSFNIALFIFIFQLVNREFNFLVDLRYLAILFSLISLTDLKRIAAVQRKFSNVFILIFIMIGMLSAIYVFMTSKQSIVATNESMTIIILYFYNLMMALTFFSYSDQISIKKIFTYMFIAMTFAFVIVISMYVKISFDGIDSIVQLPFSNISGFVSGGDHFNFIGQDFRMAGYSEDANYLALNSVLFLILSVSYSNISKRKGNKSVLILVLCIIMSVILFVLAGSKTLLLTLMVAYFLYLFDSKIRPINYLYIAIFLIVSGFLVIIVSKYFYLGDSLGTRFILWSRSLSLFEHNPLFGGGISSFRHLGSQFDWVVQIHSTYFQVISETGIIGIFGFLIVISLAFNSMKSSVLKLIPFVFLMFGLTNDLTYTNYMVMFLVMVPILESNIYEGPTTIFQLSNGLSTGGAERVVFDLANELSKDKNYKVFLILTDPSDPLNTTSGLFDLSESTFDVIYLSEKKHQFFKNNFKLFQYVIKYKPEIIHTHQISLAYCVLSYLFGGSSVKFHTVHSDSHKEFNSKSFRMVYHVLFLVFRINVVSISKYILETSKKEYFLLNKDLHHLVYNGRTSISNNDSKYRNKNDFNIVMVGRLVPMKNHKIMIESMNLLNQDNSRFNITLTIYGDGPCYAELQNQIVKSKLENRVTLKGSVNNIDERLSSYDLFALISDYEGFPISAIEAMQAGLPLILSNFGAAQEIIDSNGIILQEVTPEIIAKTILNLVAHEDKVRKYSAQSLLLSTRYSTSNMTASYKVIYEKG